MKSHDFIQLYWYEVNKQKNSALPRLHNSASTERAEEYVFRDIENVTIDHGLPGKNADMPEPVTDDTYNVSQLYKFVNGIKRKMEELSILRKTKTHICFHILNGKTERLTPPPLSIANLKKLIKTTLKP